MFTREKTAKEGLEGAKKMDKMPVESINFLQSELNEIAGTNISSPAIPQPPEYPQPARPKGLPRWQTEPQNMIDDVMTRWIKPIKTQQNYEAVQDRLRYLRAYQPKLTGEMRVRCDTAIKLLEEKVNEFETKNIYRFIRKIAAFVRKPIENEAQLKEAEDYISQLTERSAKLVGNYARAVNEYISRLKDLINNYREKPYEGGKKMNESVKELTKEVSQITGEVKGLGSPGEKAEPTPMAAIPEVLRPFWTYVLYGVIPKPRWKHTIDSQYCKIETIVPDKEWRLYWEDTDEDISAVWPREVPDWDYDEPILHVLRTNNELNITMEKYGGRLHSDIYYGDTRLWEAAGGMVHVGVGETKTVPVSVTPGPGIPSPPPTPTWLDKLKKYAPWIIGVVAIGGTLYFVTRKK